MTRLRSSKRFTFAGWVMIGYLLATLLPLISIVTAQAQTVIATVPVGTNPVSIAVNPATNKIYVSNNGSSNITVIDGATNTATTVTSPNVQSLWGIAVNPVTNKIYVADWYNVIVIDGATNSTTTVTAPNANGSHFVAVNSVTNKIYVANWNTNNVTVIDGATNSTTSVPTGANPHCIAVNEVTNKIYVPNWGSGDITVIDGATHSTTTVKDPNASVANEAVVNSVTNKIYVDNYGSNNVTVIDGATNSVATIADPNAIHPAALAVNEATNKIYVENGNEGAYLGSNNITVIDGATNSFVTISDPNGRVPDSVAVDSGLNKIYFANDGSNNVTVLDGATNSISDIADPNAKHPDFLALDPATHRVYVVNGNIYGGSNSVTVIAEAAATPTLTTLASFDGANGANPLVSLVQGTDGNLYGTTHDGGANNGGTVFKVTRGGTLMTLYDFCSQPSCSDGENPRGTGLLQATDGNLYGTTEGGGANGYGVVFKITLGGTLTTLHRFDGADGATPGGLMQANDGNLYGTTWSGGANGSGMVFKITPLGTLTKLYDFCSYTNCADGANPLGLVQATDGNFYGTTYFGGAHSSGTVFRITPAGRLTTLYSFCSQANCAEGPYPSTLVQACDGNLYGGTSGSFFKITLVGKLTVLHQGRVLGTLGVLQANDGNFYGADDLIGAHGVGSIVKITPAGGVTTLHSFDGSDGQNPFGRFQATDGNFYGTTSAGGVNSDGTVYRLSTGLPPFVNLIRHSGIVGATAQILGQGFTGTTSVFFNGTPAAFTVKSDTYLKATVPSGATTGKVTVTTPSGTLKSNKIFRVTPQILSFSPTSGPVGTKVVITGESFTGASGVTLACKWPMSFTVDSDTQITAIVPSDGTTGEIAVVTPGGRVETTAKFTVTP